MKTIGIHRNPARKHEAVDRIRDIARRHGIDVVDGTDADLVISVGGDGTLLGATRLLAGSGKLLWSLHTGSLGFLTEALPAEIDEALPRIIAGDYRVEEVKLIAAEVDAHRFAAFNEITVESGGRGQMVSLGIEIDGKFVTTIDGNGIIVATPAGSTAYNLAAGGPIVLHGLDVLVVNPICPHALSNRPIIVSSHSEVTVRTLSMNGEPHLVADGQVVMGNLPENTKIRIKGGDSVRMVKTSSRTQFDILREKLGWGDPRRRI